MKVIAHRGNVTGPDPARENDPAYIDEAIRLGFDVEIDINYISNIFFLGHDELYYQISNEWLLERRDNIWVHCKNLAAAYECIQLGLRCFCHTQDPYSIIHPGYLWLHDTSIKPKNNCIIPLITLDDLKQYRFNEQIYGVCTDYAYYVTL